MELRHLKYFVSVVDSKGYRGASRRLHIAPAAISKTLANLEDELGVKLFVRSGRGIQLTPVGEVFYAETVKTLEQSDRAVAAAQRAGRGESGSLSIGFCGAANYSYIPDLFRQYKDRFPNVALELLELTPLQQEEAFADGRIDVGFTRPPKEGFKSMLLFQEPLLAVLPASRNFKGDRVKIEDLAQERLIISHRKASPGVFDSIVHLCQERGFTPQIDNQPEMMQTTFALVAANQGVSIIPALCLYSLRIDGIQFFRLTPDHARTDMVLAWPEASKSRHLAAFVDLVEENKVDIELRTRFQESSLELREPVIQ